MKIRPFGSCVVPCGRRDGHEAHSCFSQYCEPA